MDSEHSVVDEGESSKMAVGGRMDEKEWMHRWVEEGREGEGREEIWVTGECREVGRRGWTGRQGDGENADGGE